MTHPLHRIVSKEIQKIFKDHDKFELKIDPACDGAQNLPFFIGNVKSQGSEISNVDLFIARDSQIILVCEIDESNVKPGHIFGKFLSLVSTDCCILKDDSIYKFTENLIFIQVISTEKLKEKSKKPEQWQKIEESIRANFKTFRTFKSIDYHLITGNNTGFDLNKLESIFHKLLK